jgi:Co/Zn/Cd efflux system component
MYAEVQKKRGNKITESTRFMLEVYIPSFSVCALIGVTGWITSDAIQVIISDERDDDVGVAFLYGFACANFLIDVICSGLFYLKRKDVLLSEPLILASERSSTLEIEEKQKEDKKQKANLNMISALTHVGGDTMRTVSVFVAAVISTAGQPSSLCDAWATIVVCFTICIAVIPLVKEIYKAATEKKL